MKVVDNEDEVWAENAEASRIFIAIFGEDLLAKVFIKESERFFDRDPFHDDGTIPGRAVMLQFVNGKRIVVWNFEMGGINPFEESS